MTFLVIITILTIKNNNLNFKFLQSLKDELYNKSISNNPTDLNCHESNVPSKTLFDELSCIKLEEVTHNKEKYRHKYKTIKKDLLKVSIFFIGSKLLLSKLLI